MASVRDRVRQVGFAEGISFLLLLGIAMPLKYFAGLPEAVLAVGWAHGMLFMGFVGLLFYAALVRAITFLELLGGLIASVVPLGPFLFDRWLHKSTPITPSAE